MTSINFVPWREQRRAHYRRRFYLWLLLAVGASIAIQWGGGFYFAEQQSSQLKRNAELQQHLNYLDQQLVGLKQTKVNHQSIITRLQSVEGLQYKRNKVTEFMNLIPSLIPSGVYVDKIEMDGQLIEINGISDSTADVTQMLDRLERSPAVNNVEMHSIVSGKKLFNQTFKTFKVSFVFVYDQGGKA